MTDISLGARVVLRQIGDERAAQDARWGEQNHPDGTPWHEPVYAALLADWWKRENPYRVANGTIAWDGILLEEVYEALAETDPTRLREELIQVAAVAAAWVEAIDRRARRCATHGTPLRRVEGGLQCTKCQEVLFRLLADETQRDAA